jgi:hypothetical protein
MTLVHWAAREGHDTLVKYLIESVFADVLDRDNAGMRASHHAREMFFPQVLIWPWPASCFVASLLQFSF